MTLASFVIFAFTLYLFFVVGRSIWVNYDNNKIIEKQQDVVDELNQEVVALNNEINYYQTYSYKEKEARAKLGYKAPGENVIVLPLDGENEKVADQSLGEVKIKTPNYRLWWDYFFGS